MTRRQTTPTDVPPDTLTIEEAARVLRIGRSKGYELAKEYEETGGKSGLPFIWIGGQKRVARAMLETLLGGPITWPIPDAPAGDDGSAVGDLIASIDGDLQASDDRMALASALTTLDERDHELLDLYYVQELTQTQIAERYDVSQMQVSRWLARIVGRLRSRMVAV